MWRLSNMLLKNQWVKKSNQKKNKKYIETNEKWNITHQNSCDAAKNLFKREVNGNKCLHEEKRRAQISNLTLHIRAWEKNKLSPKLVEERK